MNILKNLNFAFESIFDKLFFTIIIIIQLVVSLYFIHSGVYSVDTQLQEIQRIEKIFNIKNICSMQNTDELSTLMSIKLKEDDILERFKEFNAFLENSPKFKSITYNNDAILVQNFKNCGEFKNNNIPEKNFNNKLYEGLLSINGDKSFFDTFKFDISSGRFFEDNDFNSSEITPIILGYNYKNYFCLGDIVNYFDEYQNCEKKLKVIGFLQKDCYFYQHTLSPDSVFNLNDYIVFPIKPINNTIDQENLKINYLNKFSDTMIISDKDSFTLQNLIQNKSNDLNLINIQIKSGESMINSYKDIANTQKKFSICIFLIIIFFTSTNIIATYTNYVVKRKKQFGIHILCGATIEDIFQRIFMEICILIVSSNILMYIVSYILNKNKMFYSHKSIIVTTAISIVLIIMLSVIPLIKINRIKLSTLIRED